ncbi:MAG: BamA/TamA family outer membrane protein [candidate division Zixibacteria bacterium]
MLQWTKIGLMSMAVVFCVAFQAYADDYKPYSQDASQNIIAKLIADSETWEFVIFGNGESRNYTFNINDFTYKNGAIYCSPDFTMDKTGIESPEFSLLFKDVKTINSSSGKARGQYILEFISRGEQSRESSFRRRMRDKLSFRNSLIVEEDDFLRGSVIAFRGNVRVYGEVNRDVIALMGNITVGDKAVVRGDVISVMGRVRLDKKSSVYGDIKSKKGKRITRRSRARRWRSYDNDIRMSGDASYNRVDGLSLFNGIKYRHADSLLPSFELKGGYAFSSKRWRYSLSASQTVIRGKWPLELGGRIYRLLKSSDDLIISDNENTLFAMLFNEDWKDFYEAEGGYGYARFSPWDWNRFEIGYLSEKQRWLDAHPRLWSVFGKKEFRGNFNTVHYDTLQILKSDFDDKTISSLMLTYTIDTRDDEKNPRRGWLGYARYEYSPKEYNGDFDFKRFEVRLNRYNRFNRYQYINLTGAYGYVSGEYIPLNRQFFIGGLGTMYGYRHKEFRGNEYVYAGIEYLFNIPRTDFSPLIRYDGGKIAEHRLARGLKWHSSISVGVEIDRSVKIFFSKRLDRDDRDPMFYARFVAVGDISTFLD